MERLRGGVPAGRRSFVLHAVTLCVLIGQQQTGGVCPLLPRKKHSADDFPLGRSACPQPQNSSAAQTVSSALPSDYRHAAAPPIQVKPTKLQVSTLRSERAASKSSLRSTAHKSQTQPGYRGNQSNPAALSSALFLPAQQPHQRIKVESQLDRDGHDPQNKLQPLEPVENRQCSASRGGVHRVDAQRHGRAVEQFQNQVHPHVKRQCPRGQPQQRMAATLVLLGPERGQQVFRVERQLVSDGGKKIALCQCGSLQIDDAQPRENTDASMATVASTSRQSTA